MGAAGEWWPDRIPGRPRVLLAAALTGLLAGIVLPLERLGLGTLLVLAAAGAVVAVVARHRRDRFVIVSGPLCLLLLLPTVLLDAAWISVLCVLAAVALCLIAVTRAHGVPQFVVAGLSWPASAIRGLPWLGRSIGAIRGGGVSIPVVRTAIISVLAISVFGLLFASADALVADWIGAIVPSISWSATTVARIFIGVAVAGLLLAASYLALNPPVAVATDLPPASPLKRFEWLVPVAAIDALFALFLVAQATAFFGGEAYLRRTTGLTYADYVHQGFGQLTLITVLTLIVVALAARRVGSAAGDVLWARVALGGLCLMTLAVVGSALYRMFLYEQAYGFTRLRLLVSVFEGWLGVVVLAVMVAGVIRTARWVPRFAVVAGAVGLLLLALSNPDAWIARHNLDRYAESGKVDWFYLAHLSQDAVPVLARQDEQTRACLVAEGAFVTEPDRWNEWNLGRHRARRALNAWETSTANQFAPGGDAFLDLAQTTTCQSR